jgi:hypothetical protein
MIINIENLPKHKQELFMKKFDALMNETLDGSYDFKDIKTYEDAVRVKPVIDKDKIFDNDPDYVVALKKLRHIIRVVNGVDNWINWKDGNQAKYYNWFDMDGGDFGGVNSHYGYYVAITTVGSRLLFISKDKAEYVGKQFIELYRIWLNE